MGNRHESQRALWTEGLQNSFEKAIEGLPVIDKECIPPLIDRYKEILKDAGLPRRDVTANVQRVERVVFDGNPTRTQRTLDRILTLVPSDL